MNIPVVTASGVFVLNEGGFTPGSGDYSFIHFDSDRVDSSIFQNSNNGANLGLIPDGLVIINNQTLFITSQGNFGGQGRMFKVDATTNILQDTLSFGINPYTFVMANGNFYAANIGGSSVTKIDQNLNILNSSINVGPNPSGVIYALGRVYVSKASYTSQNSLAVIDVFSDQVSSVQFTSPPVSACNNTGGIYVSAYTRKKLYVLDSLVATQVNDSIDFSLSPVFNNAALGEVIAGDQRTLYVVGVDTAFFSGTGKAVYKYDIINSTVSRLIDAGSHGISDIYGISYEPFSGRIYIADTNGGSINGEVVVFGQDGSFYKRYPSGGKYPRRFAFKYSQ